ncbi:MAG: CBS domain-containing protein [Myxococcales bacterium]|nr:CBS domain-containing protein [Myxococcales bacterium]
MTAQPHSIGQEQTLAAAADQMRKLNVRHLPVLHGGKLVGLLSQRDIHLVQTLPDIDPEQVKVEEAMTAEPFHVAPGDTLAGVARTMADNKYGAAVVMDGSKLVGVFTTTDALRILADHLTGPGLEEGLREAAKHLS